MTQRGNSDLNGLWIGRNAGSSGVVESPKPSAGAEPSWLVLWPDGNFCLQAGPGIVSGEWEIRGDTIRLRTKYAVSLAGGTKTAVDSAAETLVLKIGADRQILTEQPADESPKQEYIRTANKGLTMPN